MTTPTRLDVPLPAVTLLLETHTTHSPTEQAALLGVKVTTVHHYRRLLYRARLLDRAQRKVRRPYGTEEPQRAAQLARQGATLRELAASLRRTEADISEMLAAFGGLRHLRAQGGADAWYSAEQAAQLLGVPRRMMCRWCQSGIVAAERTKQDMPRRRGPRRPRGGPVGGFYRISRPALADFLRDRRSWMEYSAAGICDADLRQLAQSVRAAAGGRWEKLRPLAGNPAPGTYARWRAQGWPGPAWQVVRSGSADWLWLPARTAPPSPPRRRGER